MGCGSRAPAPEEGPADSASDAAAVAIDRVELVDSVPWKGGDGHGALHRVVVHRGGIPDTIPAILTDEPPVVVGDSIVTGITHSGGGVTRGFVYRPALHRVESLPLPSDFVCTLDHEISPDGRWLAYVGRRADGSLDANVASWPSGHVVLASGPVAADSLQGADSAVEWSAGGVEIRIRLPLAVTSKSAKWLVVSGDPGEGSLASDTVSVTPG